MQLALLVVAAAAFAPTPNQRIDTRLHFNFGNFGGGKKVDEKEAVKLAETVDVVGALPTEMAGLTPELDGLRKANALFNQGLISVDEIDEYADTLAAAKRKEVAEKERDAREAAEREARARERTRAAARAATGAVGGLVGFVGRGAGITSSRTRLTDLRARRWAGASRARPARRRARRSRAPRAPRSRLRRAPSRASRPGPSPSARASWT